MTFELVLANGKRLQTNSGFEMAMFYETNGESIAPAPTRKPKKHKKNKGSKPAKAG
jgi:hypothetical protein